LLLGTLLPLKLAAGWRQAASRYAAGRCCGAGCLLVRWGLAPEEARRQGVGPLLGRVLEAEGWRRQR